MNKTLAYIFTLFFCIFPFSLYAEITKGEWSFVKESDYCYIGSAPEIIDISEGKQRGDTYILVYRINKSKDAIVQIIAGYPFKKNKKIKISIDSNNYEFFPDDDAAFTNDDDEIIFAMKKGNKLTINGLSSKGTKTTDVYTLKGFSAAYKQLFNDC